LSERNRRQHHRAQKKHCRKNTSLFHPITAWIPGFFPEGYDQKSKAIFIPGQEIEKAENIDQKFQYLQEISNMAPPFNATFLSNPTVRTTDVSD
jgi:hypothetical protein